MYINLKAEMVRHGVRDVDIAERIGISDRAFRNKISGRSEFGVKQAIQIRNKFFPDLDVEYLFRDDLAEKSPDRTA